MRSTEKKPGPGWLRRVWRLIHGDGGRQSLVLTEEDAAASSRPLTSAVTKRPREK